MDVQLQERDVAGSKILVPGLTMEWLHDGKIIAFTLTSSSHQVVEAYYEANRQLMDNADRTPDRLVIMLHDISDKNVALTPQMRSRLDTLAQRIREGQVQFRSAVVLSKSPLSMVFSFFGNSFSRTAKNTIQKFFTDRQQALQWLEQFID